MQGPLSPSMEGAPSPLPCPSKEGSLTLPITLHGGCLCSLPCSPVPTFMTPEIGCALCYFPFPTTGRGERAPSMEGAWHCPSCSSSSMEGPLSPLLCSLKEGFPVSLSFPLQGWSSSPLPVPFMEGPLSPLHGCCPHFHACPFKGGFLVPMYILLHGEGPISHALSLHGGCPHPNTCPLTGGSLYPCPCPMGPSWRDKKGG